MQLTLKTKQQKLQYKISTFPDNQTPSELAIPHFDCEKQTQNVWSPTAEHFR